MFREHRDDCMHRYLKLAIATMEIFRFLLQKRIYLWYLQKIFRRKGFSGIITKYKTVTYRWNLLK